MLKGVSELSPEKNLESASKPDSLRQLQERDKAKKEHPSAYFRSFKGMPLNRGDGHEENSLTFKTTITNLAAFRQEFSEHPAKDALEKLFNGEPEKSLEIVARLLKQEPTNVEYQCIAADAQSELGRFEVAISAYQQILEHQRGKAREAEIWTRLGVVYFKAGLYAEAQNAFTKAYEHLVIKGESSQNIENTMRRLIRTQELIKIHS